MYTSLHSNTLLLRQTLESWKQHVDVAIAAKMDSLALIRYNGILEEGWDFGRTVELVAILLRINVTKTLLFSVAERAVFGYKEVRLGKF